MNDTILISLIAIILFSIWVTYKIIKSSYLSKRQKIVNIIMTWLIPLLWGLLVLQIIKPPKSSTMTRGTRGRKKSSGNSDNWFHTTGGGGIP
tara:strand:+ start:864 stop:1139 length:276 start_codon:yes stop_codon:yes gene_type:complete